MMYIYYMKLENTETGLVGYKIGQTDKSIDERFISLRSIKGKSNLIKTEILVYKFVENANAVEHTVLTDYKEYLLGEKAKELLLTNNGVKRNGYTEVFGLDLRSLNANFIEDIIEQAKTPTQKAIMAYREWKRLKDIGEKVGQGVIADDFGVSVKQLGRVKKLESLSGSDIIEELFQGNKLNIGTTHQPILTDSLLSLINSFTKRKSEILANTKTTSISEDFTDEETKLVDDIIFKLEYEHSKRTLELLSKKLYLKLKNNEILG